AGAVSHQRVGADGTSVVEVLEDLQALRDDGMRLLPRDLGHEADAASIVLAFGCVQASLGAGGDFMLACSAAINATGRGLGFAHERLSNRGKRRIPQCSNDHARAASRISILPARRV